MHTISEHEITPSADEYRHMASRGNVIPVFKEILADTETPVSAYMKLRRESEHSFLLESVEGGERAARYSFIGIDPTAVFRSRKDAIAVENCRTGAVERKRGDAIAEFKQLMAAYEPVRVPGLPRFTGGAVGYLGYDGIRLVEEIPDSGKDELQLDDMVFALFDTVLAFDNLRHTVLLIAHADLRNASPEEAYGDSVARIERLEAMLAQPGQRRSLRGGGRAARVVSNMTRERYVECVRRCLDYIVAGDIFQIVFSQRFEVEIDVDPFDIYRVLRTVNPSPYMFHISQGEVEILGASPEILVRVEDGVIDVRPIAGTRARGTTPEEDEQLAAELLVDEKDRAEHVMLVDLGRNDVGRVAGFDTVRVTEMLEVERYSHVMHIVSNVRGRLREDMDSVDALFACYPAGTLSGAPKIRAMEIIDELEPTRRGIYGGGVGYLDFSGNLDTCIAIRTMVARDGVAYVQAGGGIVADSDPDAEFQETVNKAMALLRAIEMAQRGSIAPSADAISGLREGVRSTYLTSEPSHGLRS